MAAPMNLTDLTEEINFQREKCYNIKKFETVEEIDYTDFFKDYLFANKPCIFTPNVTSRWKSRQEWVKENNTPNFSFLRSNFGESIVPVANCGQEEFSSHPKQDMKLSEYLDYWENYRLEGYPDNVPCLYLKDWHFTKAHPDYNAYDTPVYFMSDWLNEFWDTLPQDDYRFVYMGPKGTWTPFHADVYRSFSWSANICGKKKWIFYPPGCEKMLKDNLGNLVYDIMSSDLENEQKFPNAHKVKGQQLEVIQGEGQIIFVPSGWHHQVYNLEDTISINHNWLNGCNIDICWKHLQAGLQDVKKEIEHCRDMDAWEDQCQLILQACAGINYSQFVKMLAVIAENRMENLKHNKGILSTDEALYADNAKCDHENQQKINGAASKIEAYCQIDEVFSMTKMYNALISKGLDGNAVLIDNHKEKADGNKEKCDDIKEECENYKCDSNKGKCENYMMECDSNKGKCDSHKEKCENYREKCDSHKRKCDSDKGKCDNQNFGEKCENFEEKCQESYNGNDADMRKLSIEMHENIAMEVNECEVSETDKKHLKTCEKCENNFYKNSEKRKCKFSVNSEWSGSEYLLFDLHRIKQVLVDIKSDEDYQKLLMEPMNSAEYILNKIQIYTVN